jgi:hypothetical protein
MILVVLYLVAIVAANLSLAHFGPAVAPLNAFLLIGLDLTTRDALHDRWDGRQLPVRMATLIAAGSLLSWLLDADAGRIAVASGVAFALAATTDALIYHSARRWPWLARANTSNLAGALVDTAIFAGLTGAILAWTPPLLAGLFSAKVAGGLVWSLVLSRTRHRTAHAAARD